MQKNRTKTFFGGVAGLLSRRNPHFFHTFCCLSQWFKSSRRTCCRTKSRCTMKLLAENKLLMRNLQRIFDRNCRNCGQSFHCSCHSCDTGAWQILSGYFCTCGSWVHVGKSLWIWGCCQTCCTAAPQGIVRGRSASSDVSSDISPSPLYIPPHRR